MRLKIIDIVNRLIRYNYAYREGKPLVSDFEYDKELNRLKSLDPSNIFLNKVEPEKFKNKVKILHPSYMLSIEKSYNLRTLELFIKRVEKKAKMIGINDFMFKLTPKLDGLAARDSVKKLVSRGDGKFGYDISDAFAKGVVPIGGRGKGLGEIVIVKSYFEKYMAEFFEHPRNMVVGVILSDNLNINAKKALKDRQIHFVPYSVIKGSFMSSRELIQRYKNLYNLILKDIDYPFDGIVVEVINEVLKKSLGFTVHHYRWQIALKSRGKTSNAYVKKINWQIGRSGVLTPVMEIEPIYLSGATIRRVTAHHAGNIRVLKIGKGSLVKIIRSGEVIPKLDAVIKSSDFVTIPTLCPTCYFKLIWDNNFLRCPNYNCISRVEQRITYWFKILDNTKWLGHKTICRIVKGNFNTLELIYKMTYEDFNFLGFGIKQSKNLYEALSRSLNNPVDDWRFLASFGIPSLGLGDSYKLLRNLSIYKIYNIKKELIISFKGFGKKKSQIIENGIAKLQESIINMLSMNFNLVLTPIKSKVQLLNQSFLGKRVVFTGKMVTGSRRKMKEKAIHKGFKVQNNVRKNTDYLVFGSNRGESKVNIAMINGASILSEKEYLKLIN